MRPYWYGLALILAAPPLGAQSIQCDANRKIFLLTTREFLCHGGERGRALYRVEPVDNKLVERQPELSGAYLMRAGINVNLRGDFDSTAVVLERVN